MTQEIFDIGYQSIKDFELFRSEIELMNATLVDVRLSTRSRLPQWRKVNLERTLGAQYEHIGELGNLNYKGGPVQIADMAAGIRQISKLADRGPVVLMCVCAERDECHRSEILHAVEKILGWRSRPFDTH